MFESDQWFEVFNQGVVDLQFIEYKAKPITMIPSMTPEDLINKFKPQIVSILNDLWNVQITEVTWKRVSESLASGGFSADMFEAFDNNLANFGEFQFNPLYTNSVTAAGTSMITDINSSLGANLFFNITPEVQAFINTETTSLITNMGADVKHNIQVLVQDVNPSYPPRYW